MTKEKLIKKLEELRDIENYSQSELMNIGYNTGLLDALDLVNKYFALATVSEQSEQLCDFLEWYDVDLTLEEREMEVKTYMDMKSHNCH